MIASTCAPDYGLVGRWIAHYLIGIGFASLLPTLWGAGWFREPRLGPALLVGIGLFVSGWAISRFYTP